MVRGKYATPHIMAAHLARVMQHNDELRQKYNTQLETILRGLRDVAWMVLTDEEEKIFDEYLEQMFPDKE